MIVRGSVQPPGDKSITHRVFVVAALAARRTVVHNALSSLDVRSTARALRQLGMQVSAVRPGRPVVITARPWSDPSDSLRCGNSGTTARLILGAIAGQSVQARVTGDASLRRRPMRRITTPLTAMGARVEEEDGDGLPLRIWGGGLRGITYSSPVASAQLKSAILFAGLSACVPVTVVEPARSRDHTERLLRHLGVDIEVAGHSIALKPQQPCLSERSLEFTIPGDVSSASFLMAAALLAEGGELLIQRVGVNPTRTGFLRVVRRMGAVIEEVDERELGGEPTADVLIRPTALHGTEVGAHEIPSLIDEVPILAVLAARAAGETVFRSVGELRVKESDRLGLIARNLREIGVTAEVQGEDLRIVGTPGSLAGRIETAEDHRLAMAFSVLATGSNVTVSLSETQSVGVSYPDFFRDLRRIGGAS